MESLMPPFDHALHYLGLSGAQPAFVVIGAMDGVSFDDFHGFVRTYRWSGLLVEPIPEQFSRLVANYAAAGCSPHNRYENCAIAEHNGTTQMLTINQNAIDSGLVHECFGGMSAIFPPRNGLGSEGDAETVRRYGEMIEVPCLTLQALLERHRIEVLDVLCIDAEGWDFRILSQLDCTRWRPKVIRIEYVNLSSEEKEAAAGFLTANRYVFTHDGFNLDAVSSEFWESIRHDHLTVPPPPGPPLGLENVTLVTSLIGYPSLRPEHLLHSLDPNLRLFLYAEPGSAELAVRGRGANSTFLLTRILEDFANQPQYSHLSGPDAMPLWLSLSAIFQLNDAALFNPFQTDHLLWVDAAVLSALSAGGLQYAVQQLTSDARLWLPCGVAPEREGLERATRLWLNSPLESILFSVRGDFIGGQRSAIHAFNGAYYSCLDSLLGSGETCSRSEYLTLLAHSHRPLCNLQHCRRLQLE